MNGPDPCATFLENPPKDLSIAIPTLDPKVTS
jgi:hypothetical protein